MNYIRTIYFSCNQCDLREVLKKELEKLALIPYIKKCIMSQRSEVRKFSYAEDNYDFALIMFFDTHEDIDKYLEHPLHQEFLAASRNNLSMRIFDSEVCE